MYLFECFVFTRERKHVSLKSQHTVKDAEAIKALLQAGADPNVVDNNGETPLHWQEDVESAKVLQGRSNGHR